VNLTEYRQLFFSEAQEILDAINRLMVDLEKNPSDDETLTELFRQSHTLKSMAQSMEYERIAEFTHMMEETLSRYRKGNVALGKEGVDLLFQEVDAIDTLVSMKRDGVEEEFGAAPLMRRYKEFIEASNSVSNTVDNNNARRTDASSTSTNGFQVCKDASDGREAGPSKTSTLRVPLKALDTIMDIAGELVIGDIRLSRISNDIGNRGLEEVADEIARLTSRLRDAMLHIRLVPLEYIFSPYPRMVRNIAREHGKEVDLRIEGGSIGMDRSIQDEINEPLLHILKNAVIHGMESPEERRRRGKPERGVVRLSARRERNLVLIELSDDGRGMDSEEVGNTAVKLGITTRDDLEMMTPTETLMLAARPRFSTVKNVTEGAGRGMGLSASKTKIESLGGTFGIFSKRNSGTTFTMRLPLSMAVMRSMLVDVDGETFCIPFSYIVETVKQNAGDIEKIDRREAVHYRDSVLAVIRLREMFGLRSRSADHTSGSGTISLVVVESGNKRAGLVVDSVVGQQDVVIKPLSGLLKRIRFVSGATILSTGKAALIVDVVAVLRGAVLH